MAITKKGKVWEIKNSLWMIWSIIFLLNGIGMYLAGKRAKVKKWYNNGLIYTAVAWVGIIVGSETSGALQDISYFAFFGTYVACIIHCFKIRKEYLLRLKLLEDQNAEQVELNVLKSKIAKEYGINGIKTNGDLQIDNIVHNNFVQKEEKSTTNINTSKELHREDIEQPFFKDNAVPPATPSVETMEQSTLLDINSCSEVELAELPGIGIILAKKAVNLRNSKNGFSSVDEFVKEVGIKPHFIERLKNMICCIPKSNIQTVKSNGRMVDF